MRLTENLKKLQEGLIGECVDVGHYRYFLIQDPKERTICAALFPERVLHHAIMNVTEPYFEKKMIFDTYACRRDRGTDKAVERAFDFTRKSFWFLKLDIRKYFDSISHSVLLEILRTVFKDGQLLDLFQQIIETYQKTPGKGVPIGNLTSQYFANLYLSGFDHFIKDTLGIKRYVRYMDDMCLWGNNKQELMEIRDRLIMFLQSKLDLEAKHVVLNTTIEGVPFLGFLIKPLHIYLLRSKKKRVLKTIGLNYHQLIRHRWSEGEFAAHILPVISHLNLAKSQNLIYHHCQRYDQRLEPGPSGRELEQQPEELAGCQSQQQQPWQQQQQ